MKKKGNPVAKYMRKYNKATVQVDRKKASKRGYVKHKGQMEGCGKKHEETKVECPKCDGQGCNHCDQKGYHVSEEIETNSAAKKAIYVTNPLTGKRETKMQPVHKRQLDKIHKDHEQMHEGLALPGYPEQEKIKVVEPFKKAKIQESMDPRDHTDKPGHLVVVTKPSGKKMIKHYHPTAQGAKKYADRINKTNRVGHKATVHKTDGRRIMEEITEFLVVKKNPNFSSTKTTSTRKKVDNKQKSASQSITTTSGNGYKIKRNIKTGQTTKVRTNVGGKKMNEGYDKTSSAHQIARKSARGTPGARAEFHKDGSASVHTGPHGPITSTDNVNTHLRSIGAEHGHSTKELGNKHVTKHDGHTHTVTSKNGGAGHEIHIKAHGTNEAVDRGFGSRMKAADAAANSYSKTKRKPENDTIRAIRAKHAAKKTVKEETVELDEATSKKLRDKMKELAGGQLPRSSMELRKLKAKAQAELKKGREAKRNAPKKVSYTSKGNVHMGSKGSDERNIIMQLRKAQDLGGKMDIRVSPKQGRTTRLDKKMIDQLLKNYDGLSKPQQKRAFVVQLTRALRKRAK